MTIASQRRSAVGLMVALAGFTGAGCSAPFGRLDGVLVDTRPALPSEFGRVRIIRDSTARDGAPKMSVEKGDGVVTAPDGVALVTLRDGYEVIFEPGTEATIENPSIFVRFGKLIVKALKEVKEKLTVNSEFVSAGVEGTEFVYEVTRDQTARIAVLEGRVTVHARSGGWDSVTYTAGQAGTIRAGSPPSRMQPLDSATVRAVRERIRSVENAARPEVPDLRGMTESEARPALQARGFAVGIVSRVVTREVPAGIIVSTRPAAGKAGRSGDRVSIDVADSSLVVPNLLGRSMFDAFRALSVAGFRSPDTTSQYQPNARIGTVVSVAPSDGSLVAATTRIVLTIARNTPDTPPAADSTSNPGICTVPRLQGMTEAVAIRTLRGANFRPGKITHSETGTTVTQQNPPAGRRVKCGAAVDFVIGAIGD
jgi:beta-lactam-binding protein with PASTA domain